MRTLLAQKILAFAFLYLPGLSSLIFLLLEPHHEKWWETRSVRSVSRSPAQREKAASQGLGPLRVRVARPPPFVMDFFVTNEDWIETR